MQIVGLLNGKNKNYDYQLTAASLALVNSGILTAGSLQVTSGSVAAGSALVEVTRSNGQKVLVHYQNTAPVAVTTTGTTKIYVLVDQAKIDSGIANAADGTGIGAIASGASYPASNFIPLASVTGGVITDERVTFSLRNVKRKGMAAKTFLAVGADGTETEISGTSGQAVGFVAGDVPGVFSPTVDIGALTENTSPSATADFLLLLKTSLGSNVKVKMTAFKASDSEASAGTENSKYVTPKQLHDNLKDGLGAYVGKTWGTTYQATESGIVVAKANSNSSSIMTILGYVGAADPATTLVAANFASGTSKYAGICFPVAKGQYYTANYSVNAGISEDTFYFVPFK